MNLHLAEVQRLVESVSTPFMCGDQPTVADFILYVNVSNGRSGCAALYAFFASAQWFFPDRDSQYSQLPCLLHVDVSLTPHVIGYVVRLAFECLQDPASHACRTCLLYTSDAADE